jgi:hypothetical protein
MGMIVLDFETRSSQQTLAYADVRAQTQPPCDNQRSCGESVVHNVSNLLGTSPDGSVPILYPICL